MRLGILGVVCALSGIACFPQEDSCNVRTDGVYVEYEVVEEEGAAAAKATFWVGDAPGGTNLELGDCGDAIAVGGTPLQAQGTSPVSYEAAVDLADSYEFVFSREGEDDYVSSVSPRPEVILTGPADEQISRGEAFDITWEENDEGTAELLVSGDCLEDWPDLLGGDVEDDGLEPVPAGALEAASGEEDSSCAAEISLTRESDGQMDPSLEGTVVARVVDTLSFTSVP